MYSLSFRKKVFDVMKKEDISITAVAKKFHIGRITIQRWKKKIEPCKKRNKPATKIDMQRLEQDLKERPDDYQWERAQRFGVSPNGILYALRRLGITHKKNSIPSQSRRST
jgi:transposase